MLRSKILQAAGLEWAGGDVEIVGITHNSSWVQPGYIFVAICGAKSDGHSFIPQALERGAVAIVGENFNWTLEQKVPYLHVENARQALADLSSALYSHPSQELEVVGITGTDGKTTTAWLTHHLLSSAGIKTGLLSTVGYKLADDTLHHFPAHFTTPEAPEVQRLLREMVSSGCQAAVLEVSSHALALERVRGVQFEVGVFTNLTPEHLDFHGSMEGYFAEKRKLIDRSRIGIVNADNEWTVRLHDPKGASETFALEREANWRAGEIVQRPEGLEFEFSAPNGKTHHATLPMIGDFNVYNALAAMASACALKVPLEQIISDLSSFPGVPGRMQLVQASDVRFQTSKTKGVSSSEPPSPQVIVDFAHTPPSLEKALQALRPTARGRLIVVLGSAGGPRDPGKRAPLGWVATQYADHAIFTEEDCRDTPLEDILEEMERGAITAGRSNFESVPDRRDAIFKAIVEANPEDTVLLAGKGPEDTLERAFETISWNEVEVARAALEQRLELLPTRDSLS